MSLLTTTTWLGAALALLLALLGCSWAQFRSARFQHLFLGVCVALFFLWLMRAGIVPSLSIYFLGLTTVTLMFRWPAALLVAAIVSVALRIAGADPWTTLALGYLTHGVLPVAITWTLLRQTQRRLPHNFFVYVFVCAFAGGGLAIAGATLGQGAALAAAGEVTAGQLRDSYLATLPLYVFPEGFLNGLVTTMLVVYRPQWVQSFDDELYLNDR